MITCQRATKESENRRSKNETLNRKNNRSLSMEDSFLNFDVICSISLHIVRGADWKSLVWTCKDVYKLNTPKKVEFYSNKLCLLVMNYPKRKWRMYELLSNPSMPLKFMLSFLYEKLHGYWDFVSSNPSITIEDVLRDPGLPWRWDFLSKNYAFTIKDVVAHPELPWNYTKLLENPSITRQDRLNHPKLPWARDIYVIRAAAHPKILERMDGNDEYWRLQNPFINSEKVGYSTSVLSKNPSLTLKMVLDHPESLWDFYGLASNPSISLEDMLSTPYFNWNLYDMSKNRSITIKDVLNHPEIKWNARGLSENRSITMKDVLDNPQIKWSRRKLSENPSITAKDVWENRNLDWFWPSISGKR